MPGSLDGRIALITGASRGIGRAAALAIASAGAHVVLVARTQGALEEADDDIRNLGGSATLVPLDVTDGAGIDRLGAGLYERFGRLDVLVGNAAILGPLSPLGHIGPEDWEALLAVNVTANWRLIRAMDPLLRRSEAGRAVFVTSGIARSPRAYFGGYGTTKAALEHMVQTYGAELGQTETTANLLNPGPVATAMRLKAMPGEDTGSLPTPADIAPQFVAMAGAEFTANGAIFTYEDDRWRETAAGNWSGDRSTR